jgi:hypothetical protein
MGPAQPRLPAPEQLQRVFHAFKIAVTDIAHLDAVVSQLYLLAQASTFTILQVLREQHTMSPPGKETAV